jgi:phosphogluconate dehydratase
MPELHKLMPTLGLLQDRGLKIALITDGRMSGASGKVPVAIHLSPEAADGGPISRLRDGDVIRLDAPAGRIEVKVDPATFAARPPATADLAGNEFGLGRELFAAFRHVVGPAGTGAAVVV